MKIKAFFFFLCLATLSFNLFADQLIIEPEMGREPVLSFINQSKQSLDVVMYGFTDEVLRNALIRKYKQGIPVRVQIEHSPYKNEYENDKTKRLLAKHQIPLQCKRRDHRLLHAKMLLIDNSKALVTTFNFTHSAFKQQRNFALLIEDPNLVKELQNIFNSDWQQKTVQFQHSALVISPENSRVKIKALLKSAKHSIKIYAQDLTDVEIMQQLVNAARAGVQVKMLTTKKTANLKTRFDKLIDIQEDKQYYIHAKIIIIDEKKALLGSINLTKPSLDNNREIAIIISQPSIVKELDNIFTKDWQKNTKIHDRVNWLYDPIARHKAWQMIKHLF